MDRPDSPASGPGASPLKAFLVILALIILTTVIFLMAANGEEPPDPNATRSNPPPDFSLTDEEAIARFEELVEIADRAGTDRDVSLLPLAFAEGSPMADRARDSIRQMQQDNVIDRTQTEYTDSRVASSDSEKIVIHASRLLRPCIQSESGEDLTRAAALIQQTGEWVLRLEGDQWLLWDAELVDDMVLDEKKAHCV